MTKKVLLWLLGVVVVFAGGKLTGVLDWLWDRILECLAWSWNTSWSIPALLVIALCVGWVIIVVVALVVAGVMVFGNTVPPRPEITNYKQTVFRGIRWRWSWFLTAQGWDRNEAQPFCAGCSTPLVERIIGYRGYDLWCQTCRHSFEPESQTDIRQEFEIELARRIETGEWKRDMTP